MWFGTNYGLNQFDGIRTKKYLSSKEPSSIPGNNIIQLTLDQKNKLYIVSDNGIG